MLPVAPGTAQRAAVLEILLHEGLASPAHSTSPRRRGIGSVVDHFQVQGNVRQLRSLRSRRVPPSGRGADVRAFDDPIVRRARAAVRSRGDFVARPKLFIGLSVVTAFLELGERTERLRRFAMLYLFAYTFLLRVPSEALPAVRVTSPAAPPGVQSAVFVGESELTLLLARRKNRPRGSVLHRRCWCSKQPATCPVHSLGPFFASFAPGVPVFGGIDSGEALAQLRSMAAALGVSDASRLRTHDLRRGHARDLAQSGAPLSEILRAGEWRREPGQRATPVARARRRD